MNEYYDIEKNVNKLLSGKYTFFLDGKMQYEVHKRISKLYYNIFKPFNDSENVIFYITDIPKVSLLEIISNNPLRHQDIMGSFYNFGIDKEMFGDIVIDDGRYFIYVIDNIKDYLINTFNTIKNNKVYLKEIDINYLNNYQRKYSENTIIVSSERVDTIISRIIKTNRDVIKDKIKDKDIILNYEVLSNPSKILKKGDIFSIRKFGKYKYDGVIKFTKKDNLLVRYYKYL